MSEILFFLFFMKNENKYYLFFAKILKIFLFFCFIFLYLIPVISILFYFQILNIIIENNFKKNAVFSFEFISRKLRTT